MKIILVIGAVFITIVGVYFLAVALLNGWIFAPNSNLNERNMVSGVVVDVDLDGAAFDGPALLTIEDSSYESKYTIAVPSMGLPLCDARDRITSVGLIEVNDVVEVFGDVDEEGRIVPCSDSSHYLHVVTTVTDDVLGYQFDYKKGPDGYIVLEDTEDHGQDYVSGVVLFNRNEYEEFSNSTEPREGPVAISVRVYKNKDKLSAPVWTVRNPRESNIELAFSEPVESVVGGANAEHYTTDGLFPIDTYVVASGGYVYVLMGAYPDTEAVIHRDFQALVSKFRFVPASGIPSDLQEHIDSKSDLIRVTSPLPMSSVTSPFSITGEARGKWFFEASFPVMITDWDGLIIGGGIATADGEWMTEQFVPFTGELTFTVPNQTPYRRGTIIFGKDNPSGLPEHDDALEIPVVFD